MPTLDAPHTDESYLHNKVAQIQQQVIRMHSRMDDHERQLKAAVEEAKEDREAIKNEMRRQALKHEELIKFSHDSILDAIEALNS